MDIEVNMPDIGLDEVEVIEVMVKINEKVELEQGLITVEGDKSSMEIPSPALGIVKHIYIKIGDKVHSGSLIMVLTINDAQSFITKENKNTLKKEKKILDDGFNIDSKKDLKNNHLIHATPVIRRLARNLNIDLKNITGTGRKNRILKEDVELYQNYNKINILSKKDDVNLHNFQEFSTKEIELSVLQKNIGNNLYKNWITIPHVTQFDEVDITKLEKFRKKYNLESKKKNVNCNITILVFIIKVVAYALKKFPIFNSSLNYDRKKIILKKYINIGVAVDVDDGLLVPVLKDVDKKNIKKLSYELIFLSKKARQKKLDVSDMKEGCFTISNLGGIGGSWFAPIINAPEVAILGVSKSQIKPLWNGKEFIPSLMLPLSLSYDHRVINGADAARFITLIGKLLSDIRFLIM